MKRTPEQRRNISEALKGRSFTAEHRLKISQANKGRKRSEEFKERMRNESVNRKKVRCVETGVIYHSQQEASRITGISNNGISRACRGNIPSAGGYHWEFVKEA